MKLKITLIALCLVGFGHNAEAQFLKKLTKKAEKAAERVLMKKTEEKTEEVVENAFDSIANNPNKKSGEKKNSVNEASANAAKDVNTELKRSFYTSDLIVKTAENGERGSYSYFDAEELAMKGEAPDGSILYIDSEGYQYGFNKGESRWEKTGLMKSDAMAFMLPMASMAHLNLPPGPTLETTEKFKSQGMDASTFPMVEWAFMYKPEHFRTESYTESSGTCGGDKCLRFAYNDPDYKGSYVLFDSSDRLSKILVKTKTAEGLKEGEFIFEYQPVSITVPNAVEVKMPFQDLLMTGVNGPPSHNDKKTYNSSSSGSASPRGSPNSVPSTPKNNSIPKNNSKDPSDSNSIATTVIPDNPFSYVGVTVILVADKGKQTYRLDTQNWVQEIEYNGEGLKPTYFDLNGLIYTHEPKKNIYLCADMKFMAKMFGKMFQKMLKSGEMGFTEADLIKFIGENREVIDMIMDLYNNAPTDLQNAALFPIGNWPFIYGIFRKPIFENDDYVKTQNGDNISYSPKGNSNLRIDYDGLKRPVFIQSEDGYVKILYEKHSLNTPACSQKLGGF